MRLLPIIVLLGACSAAPTAAPTPGNENAEANAAAEAPLTPPAPGTPGAPDRTPISEAPLAEASAQGAASVLERYFALVGERAYGEAWRLWSDEGRASGLDEQAFAASFAGYREYRANIGTPGEIEGAAGSLYVEVPVQIYGRRADGAAFNMSGRATLRRVNDVPGSTDAQRRWHIASIDVTPN